ncbi:MAG: LysR substrate-binding domain-containing protein [Lishizhenia sp.]
MNIQQFKYVLAVVESENFEAAAEKCFVTQSTLSTMIGKFEQEIGIKVFNRKTKPVSITKEGIQIIEKLTIINNEINQLNYLTQELKGEMVGNLNIGIIPTIAPDLIPLFFRQFVSSFSKMNITIEEMTTAQIEKALLSKSIDIGIAALPLGNANFNEIELYQEPFLIYDSRTNKYAKKVKVSELDYENLSLLNEGHCLRSQVLKICELSNLKAKEKRKYEFKSGSLDSLVKMTNAEKTLTLIPQLYANNLNESLKIKIVQFKAPIPIRQVGLITHNDFVKKIVLQKLKTIIEEAVKPMLKTKQEFIHIDI